MHLERKTIENDEDYLRQISKPVDFKTEEYKDAIKELDYFCKNDDNVMAMASVQVGIPLRLIYLKKTDLNRLEDDYNEERVLINPKIIKEEGLTRYWEACASCLNYTGLVERPYKIEVEYYDIEGKKHREIFEGFESTVLSHEIDHLNGILHIDIALKIRELTKEERKELRKKEPYQIIQKDGEYTPTKQRISPKTLKEFVKEFPIHKGQKEKPYIILLDGYTGMGKTTVSKELAKQDNSIILNNDEVRAFLNDYKDTTNLKDELQKYRLKRLLLNKNSCICDSCLCHNYEDKLEYYKSLGYPYYIIRLECSEEVVKERLEKRIVNKDNASIAMFNNYLWMKENVKRVPLELIDFTINTEEDIKLQVKEFISKYRL
ncbi:MAG TPA: peptide deformylase [Candidatus Faecimonas intestinavium]|nr:peptide deformylase [Candidatus Faecimonas intestinavium]